MSHSQKIQNLMERIRTCVDQGHYLDTRHAHQRQSERKISRPEVLFILRHGHPEKKKDKFDLHHQSWNYSIRGKTVDRRELRIIVSFDKSGLLIITAIDLKN